MRWSELVGHLSATPRGGPDPELHQVTRDSRAVAAGSVFVAIAGARVDGHRFVGGLVPGTAAVLEREVPVPAGVAWTVVGDTKRALAQAAAAVSGFPATRMPVVGITGTNGKTTVSTLLAQALEHAGRRVGRIGTTGASFDGREVPTGLTTPEAPALQGWLAALVDAGADAAVLEASSIGIAQHRLDALPFHLAVFTHLGRDHLDFHGTEEAYAAAKAVLFQRMLRVPGGHPRALLCGDDPSWTRMDPPADRWLYGLDAPDVRLEDLTLDATGARFRLHTPVGATDVRTTLVGHHNALNAAAAVASGVLLDVPLADMAAGVAAAAGAPGRMERIPNDHGITVLVDYAHTPDALTAALSALRPLTAGRLWVVFGCGGDRDAGKRPQMGHAALSADRVVVTSDNPRTEDPEAIIAEILSGIPDDRALVEVDRGRAIARVMAEARAGDVVLLAGKGHETTQTVGTRDLPFDDRAMARTCLEAR